jgi:hypothetical protein
VTRLRTGENARISRQARRIVRADIAAIHMHVLKREAIENEAYVKGKAQTNEVSPMGLIREVDGAWDHTSAWTRRYTNALRWKQRYLEGRLGVEPGKLEQHQMYALFRWSC